MSTKIREEKKLDRRVVYRLVVTEDILPAGSAYASRVVCTYHNGARLYGKAHGDHPAIVVSASDQDEVIWSGSIPFRISLKRVDATGPDHPFFRPKPWNSSKGKDKAHRLATGPANPEGLTEGDQVEYKYTITKLKDDGSEDKTCEPLDPHIILEP